jgi:nucleoid-associated protein YgaU
MASENVERARLKIEGGDEIVCAFNPASYTVSKRNAYNLEPQHSVDRPDPKWLGGEPQRIQLSLLLDASLAGPGKKVRDQADALFRMMEAKGRPGGGEAPRRVTFSWGHVRLVECVPVSLTVQYVHFWPNGEPVRATVDLEIAQSADRSDGQNPTTRAISGVRVHRVKDGDSLPSLAYDAYGDATRWRAIADANGIDNPFRLRRGSELAIPRIEG